MIDDLGYAGNREQFGTHGPFRKEGEVGCLANAVGIICGGQDCFEGGIDAIPWEQRKPYDEFDYGYVLTVHKSQGSQWDDVVLFDESFAFQESRARWLYTGITRAAKRLSIVV